MALVPADLARDLKAIMGGAAAQGSLATRQSVADDLTAAYDSYASKAQSCSAVPLTLANASGLRTALRVALRDDMPVPATTAAAMAAAFSAYWVGATFGPTGTVVVPGTPPTLAAALVGIAVASMATPSTVETIAGQVAAALDAFTRTVQARDSAVPPPAGCGPAPIS